MARKFAFAGFALISLAIMLGSTGQLQAQETAVVLLEPQTLSLGKGQISSIVVRIEGAANVYGVQLELSFDAGKIKVLDTEEIEPGVQVLSGDFLALDEGFTAVNEANNETGELNYAVTLLDPAEPASGSGTLIEFEVEALETASSDLLLGLVILASPEGAQLPVQITYGPGDGGDIIVPTAAATEPLPATVTTTGDSADTATPTAENTAAPSAAVESTTAGTPTTAGPDVENTQMPTASETAAVITSGGAVTTAVPVQTPVEEPNPTTVDSGAAGETQADPAAEIAAVPPVEGGDAVQVEEMPSPTLVVIGQNRNSDGLQARAATPVPPASSEGKDGIMEGPLIAIGLILLVVALIAIWFLRRFLIDTN